MLCTTISDAIVQPVASWVAPWSRTGWHLRGPRAERSRANSHYFRVISGAERI